MKKFLAIEMLWPFVVAVALEGCAGPFQKPRVGTGDPAVFTLLHMAAAEESSSGQTSGATTQPTSGSVRDDMLRYFRSTESDYQKTKLRADDMLDSRQAAESIAQIASSALDISAKVTWLKLGTKPETTTKTDTTAKEKTGNGKTADEKTSDAKVADGNAGKEKTDKAAADKPATDEGKDKTTDANAKPSTDADATAKATTQPSLTSDDKAALSKALSELTQDSPFDRIDRAYDFYNSLHLKLLTMYGRDSRAYSADSLYMAVLRNQHMRAMQQLLAVRTQLETDATQLATMTAARADLVQRIKAARDQLDAIKNSPIADNRLRIDMRSFALTMKNPDANANIAPPQLVPSLDQAQLEQLVVEISRLEAKIKLLNEQFAKLQTDVANEKADVATATTQPWPSGVQRLLYVVFPVSVSSGTVANQMCGIRIRLTDNADKVKVISLHPQRTYDLQADLSIDLSRQLLSIALDADVGTDSPATPTGSGSVKKTSDLDTETRRNFLSRMSKQGAVVNAAVHEFGWNFYPTNLQENDESVVKGLFNFLLGEPKEKVINAYVDSGVYNCAAWILVPNDLKSFSYVPEYIYANVDQDGNGGAEHRYTQNASGRLTEIKESDPSPDGPSVTVDLPEASPLELKAAFVYP